MSRHITEMEPGDFVKVGTGQYEEIAEISPGVAPGAPIPKHFWVITKSGRKVDMWEARSYHKKEDLEKQQEA